MPYLNQLVAKINTQLQATSLKGNAFQQGRFYGLAVSIERTSESGKIETCPCILDDFDDETNVTFDDAFPFQIYHKVISVNSAVDKGNVYGPPNDATIETANMAMIIYGDRKILRVTQEDLYASIYGGLPLEFNKTFVSTLNLKAVNITAASPNFNSVAVYSQEYKQPYSLKPNQIYFQINYKIETKYLRSCFDACNC